MKRDKTRAVIASNMRRMMRQAALSAIADAGYTIVPREPSAAAVARALSTASERCHTDETGLHRTFVPPTTDSMRAALIEYAEKGNG